MTHYLEVVAWILLHFSWQAFVIAAGYKALDLRFGLSKPTVRYKLGLAALLSMFGCAIATLIYEYATIASFTPTSIALVRGLSDTSLGYAAHNAQLRVLLLRNSDNIFWWIDFVWLAGVITLLARTSRSAWILFRVSSAFSSAPTREVALRFASLVDHLKVVRRVTLRIHPGVSSPFVAGLFRSVIYLPVSSVTRLSPDQLDSILAHELAHVLRADYAWNVFATIMEILFFFHPAVWWLSGIIREQRELCCDDIVIGNTAEPLIYASALLTLAETHSRQPQLAMPLAGGSRMQLLGRVKRILGNASQQHVAARSGQLNSRSVPSLLAALMLCLSMLLWISRGVSSMQALPVHLARASHLPDSSGERSLPHSDPLASAVKFSRYEARAKSSIKQVPAALAVRLDDNPTEILRSVRTPHREPLSVLPPAIPSTLPESSPAMPLPEALVAETQKAPKAQLLPKAMLPPKAELLPEAVPARVAVAPAPL